MDFLDGSVVKNPPTKQESWVQSLGQDDPLEKEMAKPTPVFLPGKSLGQKNLGDYSLWGPKESDMTEHLNNNQIYDI